MSREEILGRLKSFFDENGLTFESGWSVEVKMRKGGNSAGTNDVYYFSPAGKRFRSRTEIAREYGLDVKGNGKVAKDAAHTPLSRDQSKEAAVQFAAENTVPLKLLRDVKVIQFGTPSKEFSTEENLILLNYRSRWTDAPSKVVFESRVELSEGKEEPVGPSYKVYVIDTGDNGKKLRYPVGKGCSPDDVWSKVAERQKHALLREKRTQEAGHSSAGTVSPTPSSPNSGKISPVDQILKKVSPLSNVWGLEKFGFIDLTCLKAMEGQEGVEDTVYKYVNERKGWVQEQVKLRDLLGKRGKKLRLKPRANSVAQHSAADKAVEKVVESLVKKVCTWNEKIEAKLAKQKEREHKKELKKLEIDKKKKEKVLLRQQSKRAPVEDMELDGAALMPPTPRPITRIIAEETGYSQVDLQRLLEVWSLAYRFHSALGISIKDFPTLEDMVEVYLDGSSSSKDGNICSIFKAMIDFLVGELCEESTKTILQGDHDLRRVDFIPPTRNARMITTSFNNWQDVLHRYLYTVAISAGLSGKANLQYINYPLDNVHPYHIIDSMTSGPTLLELVNGDLNLLMSDETEQRIVARRDALALRRSIDIMKKKPTHPTETVLKNDKAMRLVLARMISRSAETGGSLWDICFLGPECCLEARLGYPMDMSHIISRVECLVYQMEESCFESFVADAFFACKILQTACQRGSSKIGTDKVISRRESVLNSVFLTLQEIYGVYNMEGIDGVLKSLEGQQGSQVEQGSNAMPRNIKSPEGTCFICWTKGNHADFEVCSGCSMSAHHDCLEREWRLASLNHGNPEEKQCLLCCAFNSYEVKYKDLPGLYGNLWKLVRSLHDVEFDMWKASEKIELLHTVSLLISESPAVRDILDQDAEMAKSVRTNLSSARNQLKTLQQGIKNMENNTELSGNRSMREAESKREKLIIKISRLEQDSKTFVPSRMVPLGYDRNWNKYWSLPHEVLAKNDPLVIVEQGFGALGDVMTGPQIGFYRGTEDIGRLVEYLNPMGFREKKLKDKLVALVTMNSHAPDEMAESMDVDCPEEAKPLPQVQKFQEALMEYSDGLSDASYHEIRGKTKFRNEWKMFVNEVVDAEQALAAVVWLERMLNPSCYKVHWRLWAVPVPDPITAKTLGSAWMRFETLRKAVNSSPKQNYLLCMLDSGDFAEEEASDDQETLADHEMARQLDAELNQRRTGANTRRNWQILSPRDRSKRLDRNLRDVTMKYYGEGDQEEESKSSEPEIADDNSFDMSSDDASSPSDNISE